jgi:oligopeptidase B
MLPPTAKQVPYQFEHLNRSFTDPYRWLQDETDPEVIAYLEQENAYAQSVLSHTQALQEQLYLEMRGRLQEDDRTAPENRGAYSYYTRNEAGKQYRLFCRIANSPGAQEEILLDENDLAKGLKYCRVSYLEPSPNHDFIAYAVDVTGSWVFDLYIKDLRGGQIVSGPIPETGWSAAWCNDNRTLFYTLFDAAHRPFKVMCHAAGQDPAQDTLVLHEPDDAFNLIVERSRSEAYVLITASSHTSSEVYFLPADAPQAKLHLVAPRQPWHEYYLEHQADHFWIRTNLGAENFRLMRAPVASPEQEHWVEVIPHRADTLIEDVQAFHHHLVLFERRDGLRQVRISAPDGVSEVHSIDFPDPAYSLRWAANPYGEAPAVRFFYSSLVTPEATVDYDLLEHTWQVSKQQEIPSGYDAAQYTSLRLFATAPDGAQVPISLVYRRDRQHPGPLLLYAYGSYGYSSEAAFDTRRISLLDRGFAYAIAHVRGGSEMGRAWYENGRLLHKKNTFSDFIACAEHLVAQGFTTPAQLAIMGGSAGGLLVSAVTNQRPDLFHCVVALVPFTNVVTAMLMPELPLTVPEYEQWGNPNDPQAFAYMLSYSPYDTLEAKAYPHILARAGLNDLQVPYWDPAKWVARLRTLKTDHNRLLLLTNMGAGHGGASGRYDYLREWALNFAFLLDTLNIPN